MPFKDKQKLYEAQKRYRTRKSGRCNHEWWVYSTALCEPVIMVFCKHDNCNATGYIKDYTESEWNDAFYAPSANYKWTGKGKVIVNKAKEAKTE